MRVEWKKFSEAIRLLPKMWTHQAGRRGNSWFQSTHSRLLGEQIDTESSGYEADLEAQSATSLVFASENMFTKPNNGADATKLYDLQTLIEELAGFDVSDTKDTVYALLSLAKDSYLWNPSYSKSVMGVYQDFIIYSAQTSGSLDVLLRPWANSYLNLPSWAAVSNGTKFATSGGKRLRQRAEPFVGTSQSKIYSASDSLKPSIHVQNPCGEMSLHGLPIMNVSGFLLDTVAEERAHDTSSDQAAGWPQWALISASQKGTDVSKWYVSGVSTTMENVLTILVLGMTS